MEDSGLLEMQTVSNLAHSIFGTMLWQYIDQ